MNHKGDFLSLLKHADTLHGDTKTTPNASDAKLNATLNTLQGTKNAMPGKLFRYQRKHIR